MPGLGELLLPIALSAVAVFLVSSILHMVIPIHRNDYAKVANEDAVLAALRAQGVGPGEYMFPKADSMKEMQSPEMQAKLKQGPVGTMTILPSGSINMGKYLLQWFVYTLVVGLLVAYVTTIVLPRGAPGDTVLRLVSTVAFLAYGSAHASHSIWKGVAWSTTAKFLFDALLYGLATGAVFAWLWPSGVATGG